MFHFSCIIRLHWLLIVTEWVSQCTETAAAYDVSIFSANRSYQDHKVAWPYFRTLGLPLAAPYMKKGQEICLPTNLKAIVTDVLRPKHKMGPELEELELESKYGKSKQKELPRKERCNLCFRFRNVEVKPSCSKCKRPVCHGHNEDLCLHSTKWGRASS